MLKGDSADTTFIQAGTDETNGLDRVLHIPVEDTTVDIIDLTIRYGKAPDGSDGVTATNGEKGGGIYVYKSTVFIWGSKITYNNAGHGGTSSTGTSKGGGYGGGIYCTGCVLNMDESMVVSGPSG